MPLYPIIRKSRQNWYKPAPAITAQHKQPNLPPPPAAKLQPNSELLEMQKADAIRKAREGTQPAIIQNPNGEGMPFIDQANQQPGQGKPLDEQTNQPPAGDTEGAPVIPPPPPAPGQKAADEIKPPGAKKKSVRKPAQKGKPQNSAGRRQPAA